MTNFPDLSHHSYQIIQELGCNREGGRISYLAESLTSGKKVVIKQFRFVQTGSNWQGFKAYEREINILQDLDHPRIPRYLDSFETKDGFCLVQEYQDAPSLNLKSHLDPEAIKEIAISVLEILVSLQQRHPAVIHRDLKPENILVDEENRAYLIDFGLARLRDEEVAVSSMAVGTPGFMPPEELFNRRVNEASDLYSLGATLISLLTHTPTVAINELMNEDYRFQFKHLVKDINPRFLYWLTKMVEPNGKDRFPNATVALEALRPIPVTGKSFAFPQASRFAVASVVLLFLGMAGGITVLRHNSLTVQPSTKIPTVASSSGQQWFAQVKPHCNAVEVATAIHRTPPPTTDEGVAYAAGCYALAGKLQETEALILGLSPNLRSQAANVVFNIAHPVADAGDDESAGPIMELVVKYQPENYMALYHAGMSAYILGNHEKSQEYLEDFLDIYHNQDGWRSNAQEVLQRMES